MLWKCTSMHESEDGFFPHQTPTGLGHGLGKKVEHLERVESSHFKRHCTSFGIGLGADLRELCRAGIFA
jgi:hypothetical protein